MHLEGYLISYSFSQWPPIEVKGELSNSLTKVVVKLISTLVKVQWFCVNRALLCCRTIDGCALARSFLYFNGVELLALAFFLLPYIPIALFALSSRYSKRTHKMYTYNLTFSLLTKCFLGTCFHFFASTV